MGGYNYDAEGIFPEEFRRYVLDQNLFCRYSDGLASVWVFKNNNRSDGNIADRDLIESLFETFILVPHELCLVQLWRAEELTSVYDFGERQFRLTTRNQPFMFVRHFLDKTPISEGICSYRMNMVDVFTGDGGGEGGGVIGRVFRNKRMECTPDIRYYSYEEHPLRDSALSCHIKSSLAIPLSDSSGRSVGVLEIVSPVELNLLTLDYSYCKFVPNSGCFINKSLMSLEECSDCCEDICDKFDSEYDSRKRAVSEIEEVMQVVGQSCCLFRVQTWMMCNRCSYLSISERLDYNFNDKCFEHTENFLEYEKLFSLEKGEGVVGKAASSSHNLVYCDDVSQFSIVDYPLAHFARHHKQTASFATCLQSNLTGNQIYVLEFFLNSSKVNGRDPTAMLFLILEEMRKNFRTFKFVSGEEIGDNLSVQVIDARFPHKFEIFEIGKLDSVENYAFEMDLIHNDVNVVNTIEEGGVAVTSLDKQHNSSQISGYNRGGELAVDVDDAGSLQQLVHVDGLAIDNGENMGSNIDEQCVAIALLENQLNNATISSDERGGELAIGVINSEENVVGASKGCIINSSKLPARNGIPISLEELKEVSGMKREDAAKRLNVSVSTFKRLCREYQIPRWPPRKKNLDQSLSGNSARTGSTKELRGSAPAMQNESLVTIKAKYRDNFIKFKLSASSGINEFNQQVSKRLKLEAGSYVVKYQDDDKDWILVVCDDDLLDYISSSASLGKTPLAMLLEHI